MNASVRKILLEAKLKCGNSEYVFPEAMALSRTGISTQLRRLRSRLGIGELRFHDLRHTCGTRLAELGHDVATISKVLGHSSVNMSMRYVHPKESVKRAMEDLEKFESLATNFTTNDNLEIPS
jgi:integrase